MDDRKPLINEQVTILCKVEDHDACKHRSAIWSPYGLLDCLCKCHDREVPEDDWHLCDGGFCCACNHGSRAVRCYALSGQEKSPSEEGPSGS